MNILTDPIQFLATILSLIGCVYIITKSHWGFAFWYGANVLWLTWAVLHDAFGLAATQIVFGAMSILGFIEWRPRSAFERRLRKTTREFRRINRAHHRAQSRRRSPSPSAVRDCPPSS